MKKFITLKFEIKQEILDRSKLSLFVDIIRD